MLSPLSILPERLPCFLFELSVGSDMRIGLELPGEVCPDIFAGVSLESLLPSLLNRCAGAVVTFVTAFKASCTSG